MTPRERNIKERDIEVKDDDFEDVEEIEDIDIDDEIDDDEIESTTFDELDSLEDEVFDDEEDDNAIVSELDELTHTRDIDGEKVPSYCFVHDITNTFSLSDDEAIKLAKDNGYVVYKVTPNDADVESGLVIADKECSKDLIVNDYKKFFGVEIDIEDIVNDDEVEEEPIEDDADIEIEEEPVEDEVEIKDEVVEEEGLKESINNIEVCGYYGDDYTRLADSDEFDNEDSALDYVWELLSKGELVEVHGGSISGRYNPDKIDFETFEPDYDSIISLKESSSLYIGVPTTRATTKVKKFNTEKGMNKDKNKQGYNYSYFKVDKDDFKGAKKTTKDDTKALKSLQALGKVVTENKDKKRSK